MKKKTTPSELPVPFTNDVYNDDTDQIIDYKKLVNHKKKETWEWWQQSSGNKF